MKNRKYDFAGWVTKNDIRCSDGVTIKQDAFQENDGTKVPLVWNHNYSTPTNVLGHMMLQNQQGGTYGYGYFNDSEEGIHAKSMVQNGDISAMSIGARKIKRSGTDVVHGKIYEVSLVLSGANPGAMIETVLEHHGDAEDEAILVYTGALLHSADDIIEEEEEDMAKGKFDILQQKEEEGKTVTDVLETLNDEQLLAVQALLVGLAEDDEDDEDGDEEEKIVKQNIFSSVDGQQEEFLTHAYKNELLNGAIEGKVDSLKAYMADSFESLEHAEGTAGVDYGIKNLDYMFPEVHTMTNQPTTYRDTNTAYELIINGVNKSPFSKIKTVVADFTADEARAKGYITGAQKFEQVFELLKRETTPQTVYKKQRLDRDDIVDLTDFDVVSYIWREMRFMLEEEIARAVLVGDGRETTDADKIVATKIRPIISDDAFYTLPKTYTDAEGFVEAVIKGMADYKGSGTPTLFIDPTLLADIKLLKGTDGRWLSGRIPTNAELASQMDIANIVPTSFMKNKGAVIVNLRDYTIGSSKGGKITNFDDFDIDFNQYKYLTETRLCGALTLPHSALYFTEAVDGQD